MTELKTLKCETCGKGITKVPKISFRQFKDKRYCCVKCRQEGRSKDMKGKKIKENNPNWKGNNATNLTTFHKRVEEEFGKPCFCAICETTDKEKTYDWACLTGKYEEINDYKRLCRSCHKKYDLARLGKGLITLKELPLSKRDKEIISSIAVKWVKSLPNQYGLMKTHAKSVEAFFCMFFNLTEEDLEERRMRLITEEEKEELYNNGKPFIKIEDLEDDLK